MQDKNPRNDGGLTPLHLAAAKGYIKICKYILDFVVDSNEFNPRSNNGNTPFGLAYINQHFEICELIQKKKIELLEQY